MANSIKGGTKHQQQLIGKLLYVIGARRNGANWQSMMYNVYESIKALSCLRIQRRTQHVSSAAKAGISADLIDV